jgi:predicted lipoprotein with Yx(FWY)xxD motif
MRRLMVTSALGLVLALGTATTVGAAENLQVLSGPNGVKYLADAKGMTLYYYTKDATGESVCYGNCEKAWPVFYAPSVSAPPGLESSDFGTFKRTDGALQTTFRGWPLYYWQKDTKPGDMTGEGVGKVWYILKVPAYTVMVSTKDALGNYLVDGQGRTLYWYTKDAAGVSACNGSCIQNWPAFTTSGFVVPSALDPADFGTITRSDGTMQVTYKEYPLYYWVKDSKRGDTTGQDVGKVWYVVNPEKFQVARASAPVMSSSSD